MPPNAGTTREASYEIGKGTRAERGVLDSIVVGVEIENMWPKHVKEEPGRIERERAKKRASNELEKGLPPSFGLAFDGGGREVQTPPASGETLVKHLRTATAAFRKAGFREGGRSGVHIHVSVPGDEEYLARLANMVMSAEPMFYYLTTPCRAKKGSCSSTRKAFPTNAGNFSGTKPPSGLLGKGRGLNMYYAMYPKGKIPHVEFRYFHGSHDLAELLGWVRTCQYAVRAAAKGDVDLDHLKDLRDHEHSPEDYYEAAEFMYEVSDLFDWSSYHEHWAMSQQFLRYY